MASSNWRSLLNFLAYVALVLIGIVLIVTKVLDAKSGDLIDALKKIADILAYVTVAFCAFAYADHKWGRNSKRIWYMIVWVAAVVLITLYYVL